MQGREFVNNLISSYFTVVTLIVVAMLVLGLNFYPDVSFGFEGYILPLLYGACGVLPNVVMYSRHELTLREFLVRKVIQLFLIEIIVLFVAFGGGKSELSIVISTGIGILVIFVVSHIVDWVQKCLSAKKMTEDLRRLQEMFRE